MTAFGEMQHVSLVQTVAPLENVTSGVATDPLFVVSILPRPKDGNLV
jgi:hypothetical protein